MIKTTRSKRYAKKARQSRRSAELRFPVENPSADSKYNEQMRASCVRRIINTSEIFQKKKHFEIQITI